MRGGVAELKASAHGSVPTKMAMDDSPGETTTVAERKRVWFHAVSDVLNRFNRRGGFFVRFPEYRPDLVRIMAYGLGLTHYDYRAEVMQPLGWKAHKLQLDNLDCSLHEQALKSGLVAQNVEALLASKRASEREGWLKAFGAMNWPHAVLVPLVLFQSLVPADHPRVISFCADDLPVQTLLSRLQS